MGGLEGNMRIIWYDCAATTTGLIHALKNLKGRPYIHRRQKHALATSFLHKLPSYIAPTHLHSHEQPIYAATVPALAPVRGRTAPGRLRVYLAKDLASAFFALTF